MEDDGDEPEAQGAGTSTVGDTTPRLTAAIPSLMELPSANVLSYLRLNQQAAETTSAPSGIARLRNSVDESSNAQDDAMNIDDYIFPSSIASPAGLSPSPPSESALSSATSASTAMATAIPIKKSKHIQEQSHPNFPPSAPLQDRMRSNEFGYVQRRVRKTSIDETRVRQVCYSIWRL